MSAAVIRTRASYSTTASRVTGTTATGYTVGVGYEQSLTRHVSARLEYNYADYGHSDATATAVDYGQVAGQTRLHSNAVTAGLNFRF